MFLLYLKLHHLLKFRLYHLLSNQSPNLEQSCDKWTNLTKILTPLIVSFISCYIMFSYGLFGNFLYGVIYLCAYKNETKIFFNDNGFAIFSKFWFQNHHTDIVVPVVQGMPIFKMTTLCSQTTLHVLFQIPQENSCKKSIGFLPQEPHCWQTLELPN